MGLCSEVADDGDDLEDYPALAIRYVRGKSSFQRGNRPANFQSALNLFDVRQTKFLPGTLHHSGIRPAPPSEYIPLARRSAFLRTETGLAEKFGRTHGVKQH